MTAHTLVLMLLLHFIDLYTIYVLLLHYIDLLHYIRPAFNS